MLFLSSMWSCWRWSLEIPLRVYQTWPNAFQYKKKEKKETHQIMLSSRRTNGTSYSNALIQSLVH